MKMEESKDKNYFNELSKIDNLKITKEYMYSIMLSDLIVSRNEFKDDMLLKTKRKVEFMTEIYYPYHLNFKDFKNYIDDNTILNSFEIKELTKWLNTHDDKDE